MRLIPRRRLRPTVRRRLRILGIAAVAALAVGSSFWAWSASHRPTGARVLLPSQLPPLFQHGAGAIRDKAPSRGPTEVIPLGRAQVDAPILEYHYIRINPNPNDRLGFNLSVTPADFTAQMDWLEAHDYHAVTIADLRAYFAGQRPLPARPVVLTFDDGYIDFYTTAAPVLREHGFRAVSYVVPGFVGRQRYLTADEMVALDRSGIEIASHTVHHADLVKESTATVDVELQASRGYLEQLLGHPVLDFCYPSGRYNASVEAAVARAGYETATPEVRGVAHTWADRLAWTRVRVNGGEGLAEFVKNLGVPDPTVMEATVPRPAVGRPSPATSGHGELP